MESPYIKLLESLQKEINSDSTKSAYRISSHYFTRNRILTFSCLVYMRLNLMNKSLSVEISKFLTRFSTKIVSKQAFSKAIRHIKWEGFAHFNQFFVRGFYAIATYKKFKDTYLVLATDGTTVELPWEPALTEYFGTYTNGQMVQPICMAHSVKLYDVLNQLTVSSSLSPYYVQHSKGNSEQALFEERLLELPDIFHSQQHSILLLGDKYYPSFYYFHELPNRGFNFVFRCKAGFCKEVKAFAESGQTDAVLTIDLNVSKRKYHSSAKRLPAHFRQVQVRCVRICLADAQPLFLLTNLSAQTLTQEELGQLYNLRWGEETSFDIDKNKIELENFSSKSVNGILQEFYAKTLVANIASIVIDQAQHQLEQQQIHKENKYNYKINHAVTIGLLKDEIVPFLNGTEPAQEWLQRMVLLSLPHRNPVRPKRNFPKERKHKLKFSMNLRRVT